MKLCHVGITFYDRQFVFDKVLHLLALLHFVNSSGNSVRIKIVLGCGMQTKTEKEFPLLLSIIQHLLHSWTLQQRTPEGPADFIPLRQNTLLPEYITTIMMF